MQTYPIKLTYHVRSYYFGERLIPELLGKKDAPEGVGPRASSPRLGRSATTGRRPEG
jgi:hypothetical protein